MARISSYSQDPNLQGGDRVIGTDATDRSTKNFSLSSLGEFYARTGLADVGKTAYPFILQGNTDPGTNINTQGIYVPSDLFTSADPPNATNIFISNTAANNRDLGIAAELLADGGVVKISGLNDTELELGNWEGYLDIGTFTSVTVNGETVGYNIAVTPRPGEFTLRTIPTFNFNTDRFISIGVIDSPAITVAGALTPTQGDDRYVRYDAAQMLSDTTQAQARTNIGAGTVNPTDFTVSGNTLTLPDGTMFTGGGGLSTVATDTSISGTGAASSPLSVVDSEISITHTQVSDFDTGVEENTAVAANSAKVTFPGFGTTSTTALRGDTPLLQLGSTSTTALAGDTELLQLGTSATTALAGNTVTISEPQAMAIAANSAKVTYPLGYATDEALRDQIGAMMTGGTMTGITVTYNDVDDTDIGSFSFVVDSVMPPTRSFNRQLSVAPSEAQNTGAARTWTITLANPSQTGFSNIQFGTASIDDTTNYTIDATSNTTQIVVTSAGNNVSQTIVHIPVSYTHEGSTTNIVLDQTIRLVAAPVQTTYTIHEGSYATGSNAAPIPALPTDLQGSAQELTVPHDFTLTASGADNDYFVIQIEEADISGMTVSFQDVVGSLAHDIIFETGGSNPDANTITVDGTAYRQYRFIIGGANATVRLNIT